MIAARGMLLRVVFVFLVPTGYVRCYRIVGLEALSLTSHINLHLVDIDTYGVNVVIPIKANGRIKILVI